MCASDVVHDAQRTVGQRQSGVIVEIMGFVKGACGGFSIEFQDGVRAVIPEFELWNAEV